MKIHHRSGQSLLVIVLLIAVVFTLIASASYRLTTETQTARIQEDTVRTLAAADSGIEKGIQMLNDNMPLDTYSFKSSGLDLTGIDGEKSTIQISTGNTDTFISPLVQKDEQYTFYLYEYPEGTTYYERSLTLYFGQASGSCGATRTTPALEITVINAANDIYRWLVEPCDTDPSIYSDPGADDLDAITTGAPFSPGGSGSPTFSHSVNFDRIPAESIQDPKLLIIRPLFAQTYLGFQPSGSALFPTQGHTITAEAVSTTGVSKVVTLFRSYPQIPADFFVTTF